MLHEQDINRHLIIIGNLVINDVYSIQGYFLIIPVQNTQNTQILSFFIENIIYSSIHSEYLNSFSCLSIAPILRFCVF